MDYADPISEHLLNACSVPDVWVESKAVVQVHPHLLSGDEQFAADFDEPAHRVLRTLGDVGAQGIRHGRLTFRFWQCRRRRLSRPVAMPAVHAVDVHPRLQVRDPLPLFHKHFSGFFQRLFQAFDAAPQACDLSVKLCVKPCGYRIRDSSRVSFGFRADFKQPLFCLFFQRLFPPGGQDGSHCLARGHSS